MCTTDNYEKKHKINCYTNKLIRTKLPIYYFKLHSSKVFCLGIVSIFSSLQIERLRRKHNQNILFILFAAKHFYCQYCLTVL